MLLIIPFVVSGVEPRTWCSTKPIWFCKSLKNFRETTVSALLRLEVPYELGRPGRQGRYSPLSEQNYLYLILCFCFTVLKWKKKSLKITD